MERDEKKRLVNELKQQMQGVDSIFLCNFKGLTVEADNRLRRELRASGASYRVVKNTLLKLAFADSEFSQLNEKLVGNTAIAYNQDDVTGLAKLIRDFSKDFKAFEFKAGVIQGRVIGVDDLQTIASLPSKEVLVSRLMFMLNYPIQGLVNTLSGVIRNLAVVLDQIKIEKEKQQ